MKNISIFLVLSLLLCNTVVWGQKALSGEAAASVKQGGERALSLMKSSDVSSFIPTVETYTTVVSQFPYREESERTELLNDLENNVRKQTAALTSNLTKVKQEASEKGINLNTLSVLDTKIEVKNDYDFFQGGNAIIEVSDNTGAIHKLYVRGLYFIEGQWYILNKISWL